MEATELQVHPQDAEKGFGRGPQARYLADMEIKPVLKDLHERNLFTKLSFSKLHDAAKFWQSNPDLEGVDMSAVQFYPGHIPEDVATKILETQPNTLIYQKLLPDQLLSPNFKVPRPDYEDPDNGVVIAVFYPYSDHEEMESRWAEVMRIMDGDEEEMSKAMFNVGEPQKESLFSVGKLQYQPRDKSIDEEYRLIEVWDPSRYTGQPNQAANDSLSALFVNYFSIPTKGFTPVSLTHAKFIFYTFRITPGPWKSLGRIIKGIHWQVKDEYAQVKASYNKSTGIFLIKSVEGKGDFIPALQQPSYAENIWRCVSEAIKHYMCEVYDIVKKSEIEEFNAITKGHYEIPIRWTGNNIVDYLAVYLSYFQDIHAFLEVEPEDDLSQIYFHQTRVILKEYYEPFKWIQENIYRRFIK